MCLSVLAFGWEVHVHSHSKHEIAKKVQHLNFQTNPSYPYAIPILRFLVCNLSYSKSYNDISTCHKTILSYTPALFQCLKNIMATYNTALKRCVEYQYCEWNKYDKPIYPLKQKGTYYLGMSFSHYSQNFMRRCIHLPWNCSNLCPNLKQIKRKK